MAIILTENFRALFYAPFYAAQATGAYAAAGVDVTILTSPDPATAGQALRDGTADVMWGGPLRVLTLAQNDPAAGFVCFCDVVVRDPFFIVGRTPRADFSLDVLRSVRLGTVAEVPTPWLCLQQDLRDAGIDPASIDRIGGRGMDENAEALRRDEIDAVQVFQPYAEMLLREGAGHLWYAAATRGPTAYTTLVTRRDVLAQRRTELQAMTTAMARTLRWFAAAPAEEIAGLLAGYFPGVAPDLFAAVITRYRSLGLWTTTPVMPRAGFDRLQASMRSGGVLHTDIPFESCVDNTLAEAV
jgi:NitT/TauT family transport system substrate-binding protein